MNDNRSKKDFNSPKKRTFNKSGSNNSKFGARKKFPSKYSSADKGENSNKSGEYPAKKTYIKYDSTSSDKEYKGKKYSNDKPYSRDDSNINKSSDSKYNKPYKDKKPYNREDKPYDNKNKYEKKTFKSNKPGEYNSERNSDKPFNREKPPYKKVYKKDNDYDSEKSYSKSYEKKESSYPNDRYEKKEGSFKKKLVKKGDYKESDNKEYSKPYQKKESSYSNDRYDKSEGTFKKKLIKKGSFNKPENDDNSSKPYEREESIDTKKEYGSEQSSFRKKLTRKDKPFEQDSENTNEKPYYEKRNSYQEKSYEEGKKYNEKKLYSASEKNVKTINPFKDSESEGIRLNKYIATSGICSRREADELIASGAVSVNGKVVTEMGVKVLPTDVIQYGGETLKNEKNVYLLLNKPKDFITTSDDPFNRKTVMSLVHRACKERIYPVGRLDRMTTGLLLFTNDGEMAKKLTHPKHGIKKTYQVELDKALTKADMIEITNGVELEDGIATVDVITYVGEGADKKTLGVELHSGKNRIVRRIFEHFGYNVVKLDRVYFAGLTKKDLPRGRHRFLTDIEINMLKMIS